MNNNTKVRIYGSKALFESIAKEILAEAGGKSPAQKMTDKMMGKKKAVKMEEQAPQVPSSTSTTSLDDMNKSFHGTAAIKGLREEEPNDSEIPATLYDEVTALIFKKYPKVTPTQLASIFKGLAREVAEKEESED